MRLCIVVPDGMADHPQPELGERTPLQAARTPHLDRLAREGALGLVLNVPPGMAPGSDVANLSIFGYDPRLHYTGRAPIEAAALGVELEPGDIAYRCNLVRLEDGLLADYSAGHIETPLAHRLVERLAEEILDERFSLHPGLSYRHLLVWHGGETVEVTPPHDIQGEPAERHWPPGPLGELMERGRELLSRLDAPANGIWIWGGGRTPSLAPFRRRYGLEGDVISAVDLIKGLGVLLGLGVPQVEGATGYLDTNYQGKVAATLRALEERGFAYLHIEAPDETGHQGEAELKVQAIEDFDARALGPLREALPADTVLLVLPDHPTPLEVRTHVPEPVPFAVWPPLWEGRHAAAYAEADAAGTGLHVARGHELLGEVLERARAARGS